ncbi:MAG TPA: hypothetical protein VG186_03345 [Solirubrobacteraceae bacterium]|jgi:hypothetical protein|nr:hypothetical protein [Solirubrobacteraceae bacterium]
MNQPTPITSADHGHGLASAFARARRKRYVDSLIEDYVSWREACGAVAVTYESWRGAAPEGEEIAFRVYHAALDHEERAARVYEAAITAFPGQ